MSNDNKFKFENENNDIFDMRNVKKEQEKPYEPILTDEELEIAAKKREIKEVQRRRNTIIGMVVLTVVLFALVMLWQADTALMAIGDALFLVALLEFFFGWVLFIYNKNILSPLIHGFSTFGRMFIGKRPKTDYYTYMKNIQENPIPSVYFKALFITAFIVFVPAIIIIIIVL